MRKGTTAKFKINMNIDVTDKEPVFRLRQGGVVIEKKSEDLVIEGNLITVVLEPTETILFQKGVAFAEVFANVNGEFRGSELEKVVVLDAINMPKEVRQ